MQSLSIKEAAALWDPAVSHRTAYNYYRSGLNVNGKRIYLKARWNGGRLFTTEAWVMEFQQSCDKARAK